MFNKSKKIKEKTKEQSSYKMLDNGQMEVMITYDFTKHGHSYGSPRNYKPEQIKAMLESESTQEHIKNNYCKGYYGHQKRNKENGYLPDSVNSNGKDVYPICRTTEISVDGNFITHKTLIFNSKQGVEVQDLVRNGGVGFSNVWNVGLGRFFGFDAVPTNNFAGNRVVLDSAIDDFDEAMRTAVCDMVGLDANTETKKHAWNLLQADDSTIARIEIDTKIQTLQAELDSVNEAQNETRETAVKETRQLKEELKESKVKEKSSAEEHKDKEDKLKEEIGKLKEEVDEIEGKAKKSKAELDGIKQEMKNNGIVLTNKGIEREAFDSIVKATGFNLDEAMEVPDIKIKTKTNTREESVGFWG